MTNGHEHANGNGVMDSMDDASSTSGSTAHVQVGGTEHLKSMGLPISEPACQGATQACKSEFHASAYNSSCTRTMCSKWTLVAILLCVRVCVCVCGWADALMILSMLVVCSQDSQRHQPGHAVQTVSPSSGSKGPFQGTGQWHLSNKSSDPSVTIKGEKCF